MNERYDHRSYQAFKIARFLLDTKGNRFIFRLAGFSKVLGNLEPFPIFPKMFR